MSKSDDTSTQITDRPPSVQEGSAGFSNRPYEPDPNLTPEENANRAREHKLKMVENEPGPKKVSLDDLQRGTAPGKDVDPGDGNPYNSNPPIDPEILRMRREKIEDHESEQRVALAEQQAEQARKQGEEQKANREEAQRARDEAQRKGDGTDRTGASDRTVNTSGT